MAGHTGPDYFNNVPLSSTTCVPRQVRYDFDWITDEVAPGDLTAFELTFRSVDWASTYFGPIQQWSPLLRILVRMCLADPDPAALFWGDNQDTIYNEAYIPLIGDNHPRYQGQSPWPIFGHLWNEFEVRYKTCKSTGAHVIEKSVLTVMTRHGYKEECYFDIKWAPYINDDGKLLGVYANCSDTTDAHILRRRIRFIEALAQKVEPARDLATLSKLLATALSSDTTDLPSAMLYTKLVGGVSPSKASTYSLELCVGARPGGPAAPERVITGSEHWYAQAMERAATTKSIVVLQAENGEMPSEVRKSLNARSFNERSVEIALCPIFSGSDAVCFLVVGLNPKKRYDLPYHNFLQRLCDEIISPRLGIILLATEKAKRVKLTMTAKSDRARRLEEMEESERKYRQFAENAPLGMVRLNTDGRLVYTNATWRQIYSYSEVDDDEQAWLRRVHPDHVDQCREFFTRILTSETFISMEHKLIKAGNNACEIDETMASRATWLLVNGYREDEFHVVLWVVDISAHKAAALALKERMEEALIAKTRQERFIDMVSHELRNPMSAILHCSEEIQEAMQSLLSYSEHQALMTAEQANWLATFDSCLESAETILYCNDHQKRIIDDVLALSKLDANLLEIHVTPVDIRKAIRSALKIFDRELRDADINLVFVEDRSLTEHDVQFLMLDTKRFLQILINLITNSIKFTRKAESRTITVQISISNSQDDPKDIRYFPSLAQLKSASKVLRNLQPESRLYLAVSVADTGKGLADDEKERLFNRFLQASPKTYAEYGGSGLGLFISRQITELMGGHIGISYDRVLGCKFAFFVATTKVNIPNEKEQDSMSTTVSEALHSNIAQRPAAWRPPRPFTPPIPSPPISTYRRPSLARGPSSARSVSFAFSSDSQPSTQQASPLNRPPTPPARIMAKILVVEDNLINQKLACKQLKARGYEVYAANHGEEAIEMLKDAVNADRYYSVVLCDIEMPVMDGMQCVHEIRKLEKERDLPGRIPVVAVTANARSMQVDNAIQAGMDGVTTKPYRMDDLVEKFEMLLQATPS